MNIPKRLQQLAKATQEMNRARLAYNNLRQDIGKEFRQMRKDQSLKAVSVATAIKESPVYVYMMENGNVLLTEKRIKTICAAIERLGRWNAEGHGRGGKATSPEE
jgi:ribosome-binding protein aMBF1 (putative translation factor)